MAKKEKVQRAPVGLAAKINRRNQRLFELTGNEPTLRRQRKAKKDKRR